MNQKFYKINCYYLNPDKDGFDRFINPNQISLISPIFQQNNGIKSEKVIGSSIKLSSDTSTSYALMTSYTPEQLIEMFSK